MPNDPEYQPPDRHRDQMLERPLPHSADAERAILGAIILDNNLIAQAVELLKPEDFYVRAHQFVFRAMIRLFEKSGEISPIIVGEELKKEGELEQVGGLTLISELTYGLPHFTNVAAYAKVVKDHSIVRQLIKIANKITNEGLEGEDEAAIILDHAQEMIFSLAMEGTPQVFSPAGSLAHTSLHKAHLIQQHGSAITGVPSGFTELDSMTLGWQPSDLIIVAARPSMGKTALSVDFSLSAAMNFAAQGANALVAYFSLEMNKEQIINRMLCNLARVDSQKYRSGYLNEQEWERLYFAEQTLAGLKIFIDDTPSINTLQIRAKARRLAVQEKRKLGLVVVDYIQLMSGTAKRSESRQQEITQISRELKGIAKELDAPFIVDSQLNRGPESRTDHRPLLSDLRESGSIEQDADLVAFIYREDKYRGNSDPAVMSHTAEIILAKQRNGPTGTAMLRFDEVTGKFDNLALNT